MSIPWQLHEGNRAEYLAMYFLSKVGFVIPVPRQADYFQVDFVVHLTRVQGGRFVPTGKCFAIQIKSNTDPVPYEATRLACLWELGLPYFLGVVSRDGLNFSIYSTLPRLNFRWMIGREHSFKLCPGGTIDDFHAQEWHKNRVSTGPAILELTAHQLDNPTSERESRKLFFDVMTAWTGFEERSLSWKRQQIPVVDMPQSFQANVVPSSERIVRAVAHPASLPMICQAVEYPLFSLGYYLHDLMRRVDEGELSVSPRLLKKVQDLDKALEQVKAGREGILQLCCGRAS